MYITQFPWLEAVHIWSQLQQVSVENFAQFRFLSLAVFILSPWLTLFFRQAKIWVRGILQLQPGFFQGGLPPRWHKHNKVGKKLANAGPSLVVATFSDNYLYINRSPPKSEWIRSKELVLCHPFNLLQASTKPGRDHAKSLKDFDKIHKSFLPILWFHPEFFHAQEDTKPDSYPSQAANYFGLSKSRLFPLILMLTGNTARRRHNFVTFSHHFGFWSEARAIDSLPTPSACSCICNARITSKRLRKPSMHVVQRLMELVR